MEMNPNELVKALRDCASGEAEDCPFTAVDGCGGCPKVSADLIERLSGEVEDLRRKLAMSDKDGRVVVLPCKVGDTVWRIKRTFETYPDKSKPYIEPDAFLLQDVFNIGKTVFLTREEAEKALAEMEDAK